MPEDKHPDKPVLAYESPRSKPEVSGVAALAGILISGVLLIVISFLSGAVAGVAAAMTGSGLLAGGAMLTLSGTGIWLLHRVAWNERDSNRGFMIGIYIGIGAYLLLLGTCGVMMLGARF